MLSHAVCLAVGAALVGLLIQQALRSLKKGKEHRCRLVRWLCEKIKEAIPKEE